MELEQDTRAPVAPTTPDDFTGLRALAELLEITVRLAGTEHAGGASAEPGGVVAADTRSSTWTRTRALLVVCASESGPSEEDLRVMRVALAGRTPVVLAIGAEAAPACTGLDVELRMCPEGPALAMPSTDQPLVLDPHLHATGLGRLVGLVLEADDLVAIDGVARQGHQANELAQVRARVARDGVDRDLVVARSVRLDEGQLHVVGSAAFLTDRWLSASDNAAIVAELLHELRTSAGQRDAAAAVVAHHRPESARRHAPLPVLHTAATDWHTLLDSVPEVDPEHPEFVLAAGRARRRLPEAVHDALVGLQDEPERSIGALLLTGVPIGSPPPTPSSPTHRPDPTDVVSEFTLLTLGRALGQPVGYAPEHGGTIVQNLLPTPEGAHRQTSTSSAVELEFHTETAFHPHKPRYLLLLCLRGDPAAATLLCSVSEVLHQLPLWVRRVLSERRFRTGVDESFSGGSSNGSSSGGALGPRVSVLSGDPAHPTLTFDADLMQGIDDEAQDALDVFRSVALDRRIGVTLQPGDALVVDNHVCIHGRSAFEARYDGTDRWLQRSFVVSDLSPSAAERRGRVVTTRFV